MNLWFIRDNFTNETSPFIMHLDVTRKKKSEKVYLFENEVMATRGHTD